VSVGQKVSRREFVQAGAGIAAVGAAPALAQGPTVYVPGATKPVVIASANGNHYKNGGPRTAVDEAFTRMTAGEDVLDALIAGVNIVELDPEDDSVGYGGLPNALGVVQLDSCCMHGPRRRAGGVAAIGGVTLAAGPGGLSPSVQFFALLAFPAIILGGLDSPGGAVVGGIIIGLSQTLTAGYQGDYAPWLGDNFQTVMPYVVMVIVLLVRPYGLFGTKEVKRI